MVTGYTRLILEGCSLNEFILHCAKAFLIQMKERSGDIPEKFEIYDYHLKKTKEAKIRLNAFLEKNDTERKEQWKKESNDIEENIKKLNQKMREEKEKYETMLIKVKEWNVPSANHQGLKDFMVKQIESSIDWDIHFHEKAEKEDFHIWEARKKKNLQKDIIYHTTEYEKEIERTKNANEWIQKLRNSLKEVKKNHD